VVPGDTGGSLGSAGSVVAGWSGTTVPVAVLVGEGDGSGAVVRSVVHRTGVPPDDPVARVDEHTVAWSTPP
jgi:hypothetical protein